ncbi:MAG: type IV pilus twitching motility protein PilT [Lachnospiraceae bacterium]|nr:type IV pilus twitching motility protein PilT [Lachnospiraceae bacterium]
MTFVDLVDYAKREGASDIHVTVGTNHAIRKYGELIILEPAPSPGEAVEMIFSCLSEEQRSKVTDGKDLDFALIMPDGTRLRANIYHQRNNIAGSFRLLQDTIPTFDKLGIPKPVQKLIDEPRGLVLFTGPTGSGKTTTLASMIDYVNKNKSKHVITIEDPIEYVYYHEKSMIHQRELGRDVESFATALHSALREDPDIILVGEMRDFETINAAMTAAETGHLVLSTLHTSSAAQTIERIIDAYPAHGQAQARTQLATNLKGVVTQVLVPSYDGDGMVMATEVLLNNDAIANQIRENKTHQIASTIVSGVSLGMHTLNMDLRRLVREQRITDEEARKFASNIKEYEMAKF